MYDFRKGLKNIDAAICDAIDSLQVLDRGQVSRTMLSECRNLVEHIAMLLYSESHELPSNEWDAIENAKQNLVGNYEVLFLRKFHHFLEQTRSHYTPDKDGAERLILKYYEYLVQCKNYVHQRFNMTILHNLNNFPVKKDARLQEYYDRIAEKIDNRSWIVMTYQDKTRFYVQKQVPFFVGNRLYYEITFSSTMENAGKLDRFVAFANFSIPYRYAIQISYAETEIDIANRKMPIKLVDKYSLSIRPCELKNFAKILGVICDIKSNSLEYQGIMNYMGKTGLNLTEIVTLDDVQYKEFIEYITYRARAQHFLPALDEARKIIRSHSSGENVLRYLLYLMNNRVLNCQYSGDYNYRLSKLCLQNGCIPFETMPLCASLIKHNPSYSDVTEVIEEAGREHEVLAHILSSVSVTERRLYIKRKDIEGFDDIDTLQHTHNDLLYSSERHQARRIESFGQHLFIKQHEDTSVKIINKIIELSKNGIGRYTDLFDSWINENPTMMDSPEKKNMLRSMFSSSCVSLIYGAAGTGKSYMMNHIAQLFDDKKKLFLANTHPAVDNMKRKIKAKNCDFSTVARFTTNDSIRTRYDIVFVDESSTVSNEDMVSILDKAEYKLLVLVGDVYQIEAITFGNWFGLVRYFVPDYVQHELTIPYRTENTDLLTLWDKVRNKSDDITEHIVHYGYSHSLDETIFDKSADDEIVLCLNYDGLYGINNINRFLQNSNDNPAVKWGIWSYKVGDPILFEETERFSPLLYNNLKGVIRSIDKYDDRIVFAVEIDKVLTEWDASIYDFEITETDNSHTTLIKFSVFANENDDDDDVDVSKTVVPFRIAYAISIHKAQGLEYDSVKVVITRETDELISHNIFYTAITRAKRELKIYWTPESQKKIIEGFKADEGANDANILSGHRGLKRIRHK